MKCWYGTLRPDTDLYRELLVVYGSVEVPIEEPIPVVAWLGPDSVSARPSDCYFVDVARLSAAQRRRCAEWLARRFHAPVGDVLKQLDTVGLPIMERYLSLALPENFDAD